MNEQLITFETAVLAKQKGFDIPVKDMWIHNTTEPLDDEYYTRNCVNRINHNEYAYVSAPTQSLLQKWLRDIHSIWVTVVVNIEDKTTALEVWRFIDNHEYGGTAISSDWNYNSYEDALEGGLQEALKLI